MSSIFSINQDSFIYAVRQALDARTNPKTGFNSHLKYTPFLDNTWEKPRDANLESLKKPLKDILQHHWKAIPHYKRNDLVNLETISWFAHSIACLYADIEYLFTHTLGHGFLEKQESSNDFWSIVTNALSDVFKDYAILLTLYTDWKHTTKDIPTNTKTDWNVRPPCGLLYKTEFKALFDELRQEKFGKKPFGSKDQKKSSRDTQDNKNNSFNNKQRKPQHHDKKNHRKSPEASEAELKVAKEECANAIETMKKNKKISEIPLAAQNSFLRREQHTMITEAGLFTDSRGDGNNRHVCILRHAPKEK